MTQRSHQWPGGTALGMSVGHLWKHAPQIDHETKISPLPHDSSQQGLMAQVLCRVGDAVSHTNRKGQHYTKFSPFRD